MVWTISDISDGGDWSYLNLIEQKYSDGNYELYLEASADVFIYRVTTYDIFFLCRQAHSEVKVVLMPFLCKIPWHSLTISIWLPMRIL